MFLLLRVLVIDWNPWVEEERPTRGGYWRDGRWKDHRERERERGRLKFQVPDI